MALRPTDAILWPNREESILAPNTKRVFYVRYLPSATYPAGLVRRPDVQLDKLETDSPDDVVTPILAQAGPRRGGRSRRLRARGWSCCASTESTTATPVSPIPTLCGSWPCGVSRSPSARSPTWG